MIIYIYIYAFVNNDCEYPKKECSLYSYLILNIPAEQNIYFCLKKNKKFNTMENYF